MRLIAGLSENHQRPTATRDERLSFVVTLAGSAAAVSVKGSMRSEEIVSTMGGAPKRLYFVPAAGSGGGKAICAASQWPHSVLHLEKTCIECKKVFYQKKKKFEVGRFDFQSIFTNHNLRLSEDEKNVRECFVVVAEG